MAFLLLLGLHPCLWILTDSVPICKKQAGADSDDGDNDPNADVDFVIPCRLDLDFVGRVSRACLAVRSFFLQHEIEKRLSAV